MTRAVWVWIALGIHVALGLDIPANHTTILNSNPNLQFLPSVTDKSVTECSHQPELCNKQWWIEPASAGLTHFSLMHTTSSPDTSWSIKFKGSSFVAVAGFRASGVDREHVVLLNDAFDDMSPAQGENEQSIYERGGLDNAIEYTLTIQYAGGSGTLSIAAVYLSADAQVLSLINPSAQSSAPALPTQTTETPALSSSATTSSALSTTDSEHSTSVRPGKSHSAASGPVLGVNGPAEDNSPIPAVVTQTVGSAESSSTMPPSDNVTVDSDEPSPTAPSQAGSQEMPGGTSHSNAGVIAGGCLGGIAALALAVAVFRIYQRRRRRAASQDWLDTRATTWGNHWTTRPSSPGVPDAMDWENAPKDEWQHPHTVTVHRVVESPTGHRTESSMGFAT
ncbi:hypothetical protein EXIGLDRAFT_838497 [Exidia glandulosa HHB12029]|uniref:Mid2 domain-containing protein n=1 Tax=Exidia glandulosa HHB12029 TaxID=1314781 RepID=A0A165FSQ1_EXIGL|nr:hypothetical protein EXIGLDRAFT_838497 [Exidia glandulosa HHB12029]